MPAITWLCFECNYISGHSLWIWIFTSLFIRRVTPVSIKRFDHSPFYASSSQVFVSPAFSSNPFFWLRIFPIYFVGVFFRPRRLCLRLLNLSALTPSLSASATEQPLKLCSSLVVISSSVLSPQQLPHPNRTRLARISYDDGIHQNFPTRAGPPLVPLSAGPHSSLSRPGPTRPCLGGGDGGGVDLV